MRTSELLAREQGRWVEASRLWEEEPSAAPRPVLPSDQEYVCTGCGVSYRRWRGSNATVTECGSCAMRARRAKR